MQTSVGHRPLSYFETRFSCEEWENYIYGSLLLPLLKEGQKEVGGGGEIDGKEGREEREGAKRDTRA